MEVFAKSGNTVDQAGAAVHDAIDRVSGAARPAVDRIASGAHTAVDKIADAACKVSDTLGAKSEQLKEAQAKVVGSVRGYVSANPLATVGIAVAAGFLISRLLRAR